MIETNRAYFVWLFCLSVAAVFITAAPAQAADAPTAVTITRFEGFGVANGVRLEWATGTEFNTAGFWVERANQQSGPFNRLVDAIGFIPATGFGIVGDEYQALDDTAVIGTTYWYRLVEVELDGDENIPVPPIAVTAGPSTPTATPGPTITPSQTPPLPPGQTAAANPTATATATPTPANQSAPGATTTTTPAFTASPTPAASGGQATTATLTSGPGSPAGNATAVTGSGSPGSQPAVPTTASSSYPGNQNETESTSDERPDTGSSDSGQGATGAPVEPAPGDGQQVAEISIDPETVVVVGSNYVPPAASAPPATSTTDAPSRSSLWPWLAMAVILALLAGAFAWYKLAATNTDKSYAS